MRTPISRLDPTLRSRELREFERTLRRKIVGQDKAVQAVAELYQVFRAGLSAPGRPVGNLLFLGPTGAGKTRVVEAAGDVISIDWDGSDTTLTFSKRGESVAVWLSRNV